MSKSIIKVSNLSKRFNDHVALDRVDFDMIEGEIMGFLGPSGAGKTTTINILTGQLNADKGNVQILGKNVGEITREDLKSIGIVSDNSGYYENLTLYQNLMAYAKIYQVKKEYITELLQKVGLEKYKDKIAKDLSTGMKQRMLLARSLINKPDILFLDEPTSGLDPTTSQKIQQLILELKREGTSIFLTTHDMGEATLLCDKLVLLNNGKIIEKGSPHEIIRKHNNHKKVVFIFEDKTEYQVSMDELNTKYTNKNLSTVHSCEPSLNDIFIKLTGVNLND